jgi:hypothetical protein
MTAIVSTSMISLHSAMSTQARKGAHEEKENKLSSLLPYLFLFISLNTFHELQGKINKNNI